MNNGSILRGQTSGELIDDSQLWHSDVNRQSKITDIKQQVKRPDRYSIFVDGRYAFSLSANGLLDQHLYVGMELAAGALTELEDKAAFDKLYGLALAYIMRRRRSEWEMQQYYRQKKADPDLAVLINQKLQAKGYIDDLAFARSWIDNRRTLKQVSRRRLVLELRQKQVSSQHIEEALGEDTVTDGDSLRQLIVKKRQQSRYQDDQKLLQYLARQGFGYDDIKQAMSVH